MTISRYRIKRRGAYGVWGKVFYVDELVPCERWYKWHKGYFVRPLKWFWTQEEAQAHIDGLGQEELTI